MYIVTPPLLVFMNRMEDVDHVPIIKQRSVPAVGSRGGGSEREKQLAEENSELKVRLAALEQVRGKTHTHTIHVYAQ